MSMENRLFGYTQEEERWINGIRHNNHRDKNTGKIMEPERLGWDTEDNSDPMGEVNLGTPNYTPEGFGISSDPFFNCPVHKRTSNVVTFHINGIDYVYCTMCLHEMLSEHFEPLERIDNEQ